MKSSPALLRLIRQSLAFLAIIASLFLSVFLAFQTPNLVRPDAEVIRYNTTLAEIYQATTDWGLAHYIERQIELDDLDADVRARFATQLWSNYLREPQEYRYIQSSRVVATLLGSRAAEFHDIIRNRVTHRLPSPTPDSEQSALVSTEVRRSTLAALLQSVEEDARTSRQYIQQGNRIFNFGQASGAAASQEAFTDYQELQYLTDAFSSSSQLLMHQTSFTLISPRYELVVYDGFQKVKNRGLLDIGQQILTDPEEEALLRLVAADHLSIYMDRSQLIAILYGLIADAKSSGSYIRGGTVGHHEDSVFEQAILTLLGKLVNPDEREVR